MASSAGMRLRPKSEEDPEELQKLYDQVWAAFADDSSASNDSDFDNIYGGYADDNLNDNAPLSRPPVPPKRT
jgi:hypothetical protein